VSYAIKPDHLPPVENEIHFNSVINYYRFVNREMIGTSSERTLISTIIPPGVSHINTCLGTAFKKKKDLLNYFCMTLSIPLDYNRL